MEKLRAEIAANLNRAPDRRVPITMLARRLRTNGWGGFSHGTLKRMLVEEMGFYLYPGCNDRNMRVLWVSTEPPPDVEPNEFSKIGFVLITPDGRFYQDGTKGMYTYRRYRARVWRDYGWAHRFAVKNALMDVEIASTKHLGDTLAAVVP